MTLHLGTMTPKVRPWDKSEYTELYDLMEQAKRFEVVEDDDFKMTIDYQNMTSTFEVK